VFDGIGQNTATNQASTPATDFNNFCGPPTIVTANLGTGTLSSFLGVTSGFAYGMAVDSTTNRAVVPTICDGLAGIYDLGKKTGTAVNPKGSVNIYPAIDATRGLIVMDQVVPADFGLNNNAMSSAVVMDERGNVLATFEQFFFFNTFLTIGANNLQLDPATRTAYTLGPGQQELEPSPTDGEPAWSLNGPPVQAQATLDLVGQIPGARDGSRDCGRGRARWRCRDDPGAEDGVPVGVGDLVVGRDPDVARATVDRGSERCGQIVGPDRLAIASPEAERQRPAAGLQGRREPRGQIA